MKNRTIFYLMIIFILSSLNGLSAQDVLEKNDGKFEVVWSGGLFKSWLKDDYVDFDIIDNRVSPIYDDKYKMGFALHSYYMYKPIDWLGIGIHLGLGLDINSFIEAPLVLFGGSLSLGNDHQFILNAGWSDGKRRKVPGSLRNQLDNSILSEIPTLAERTELNTAFYLGISYRI